jgi:iron complex transport system substrate-binding protein
MRTSQPVGFFVAGIASLALLGGCGSWRDATGRTVNVALPVARIASLAPSVTEIIYAIDAQDSLVAVSNQCDAPLAAKLKPKIGNFNRPDLEKARELRPDVVLFAEYVKAEDLEALEKVGIKTVVLSSRDLADLSATIRLVGRIAGRVEKAEAVAAALDRIVAEVSGKVAAVPPGKRPGVYIEVDGPSAIYAVGSGSFMGDVVRVAGGRNVFEQRPGPYLRLTDEEIIRARPEVILVDHPFQYKVGVSKRPGWAEIPAVKNGRVYDGTDYDMVAFNRASPRIGQSLREIARLLHPELFREP